MSSHKDQKFNDDGVENSDDDGSQVGEVFNGTCILDLQLEVLKIVLDESSPC